MNEAYKVLMSRDMRRQSNASIGWFQNSFGKDASGVDYSVWNGPLRPQALFVDQNACIGIIIIFFQYLIMDGLPFRDQTEKNHDNHL